MAFQFSVKNEQGQARTGVIKTPHGKVHTPTFVPVGTAASVKTLTPKDLQDIGAEIILANTYHLFQRPGDDIIKKLGGLHKFMSWNKPIMTDSGGFQAFSLGLGIEHGIGKIVSIFPDLYKNKNRKVKEKKYATINDKGIRFKSPFDNRTHLLTPEKSIAIQQNLGADIILNLDECTSPLSDYDYTKQALERTHQWALRCKKAHTTKNQALFGIIQGSNFKDLRQQSSKYIRSLKFPGYAIGGALGNSKREMHKLIEWCIPLLEKNKPRHMLGVGGIEDFFSCVDRGLDTFDCVTPTRLARQGFLFVSPEEKGNQKNKFRIRIDKGTNKLSKKPIDKTCECYTCQTFTRAYLHHLYKIKDLSYYRLATYHNVHFFIHLLKDMRISINENRFKKMKKKWLSS